MSAWRRRACVPSPRWARTRCSSRTRWSKVVASTTCSATKSRTGSCARLWAQVACLRDTPHRPPRPPARQRARRRRRASRGSPASRSARSPRPTSSSTATSRNSSPRSRVTVGADRSVTSAVETLGPETVGAALPACSPTHSATRPAPTLDEQPGSPGGAAGHRRANGAGCAEPTYVPLERISRQRLFTAVMLVAVTYFLLAATRRPARRLPRDRRRRLELGPARRAVLGADLRRRRARHGRRRPQRLRAVPTLLAQVAASFASNLAPAGVGGMALNVRYLRKSGVDAPVAASSVGLNAAAGFAVHIGLDGRVLRLGRTLGARFDLAAELARRRHRRRRGRDRVRGTAVAIPATRGCSHETRARRSAGR